jgi:octaprenyl-diphosphate synthase
VDVRLSEIIEPIKHDLEEFEREFKNILKSDIFLIDKVVHYIVSHRGKRLRPILVLLTSRLNGAFPSEPSRGRTSGVPPGADSNHKRLKAAAILELLHTATLVHDDVVDDSDRRRGFPTVNSIWKNKISVLMGDYLFSKALLAMLHMGDVKAFKIISNTAERMSQGELLQVERSHDFWMEEEIYFRLIADKTASLLAAACQLGALAGGQTDAEIEAMGDFGEHLGLAFQIRDDLLDLLGVEHNTGKPIGNDIRENKITLPLLYALKQAEKKQAKRVIKMVRENNGRPAKRETMREIVGFIEQHGGVAYATQTAENFSAKAMAILQKYEDSPVKTALGNLIRFITARDN